MTEIVLYGPFLTRAQAARRAGLTQDVLLHRPDLLRITSPWLPEVYLEFQFDAKGVRTDVGRVVQAMQPKYGDLAVADWLVRPNRALGGAKPLQALAEPGNLMRVLAAAETAGPDAEPVPERREAEAAPAESRRAHRAATPERTRAAHPPGVKRTRSWRHRHRAA